jgi:hypothetical protein
MKPKKMIWLLITALVLTFSTACQKDRTETIIKDPDNNQPIEEAYSNLKIHLAANYSLKSSDSIQAVNIDLQQIRYHTSTDTATSGGWVDLETVPGIYNLMDFVEDDTLVAFDTLLATQTISQLRLFLGDSNTVMIDSMLYDLFTPSAQSSGLKVQVHTQMVPDSTYVIMLDFDPEQSVKQTGNGKYILKPVIRTIINP